MDGWEGGRSFGVPQRPAVSRSNALMPCDWMCGAILPRPAGKVVVVVVGCCIGSDRELLMLHPEPRGKRAGRENESGGGEEDKQRGAT